MSSGAGRRADAGDPSAVDVVLGTIRDLLADLRSDGTMPAVRLESRLDADLGLDSLAMAELLVRIEQQVGVTLPDQILATAETPHDLVAEVEAAARRPADGGPRRAGTPRAKAPAGGGAQAAETAGPADVPESGGRAAAAAARPPVAPSAARSLVEVLDWHANEHPDRFHVHLLDEVGDVVDLSYGALHAAAADVAAGLRHRGVPPGASVAMMLPTSRDYFVSFLGVMLAGCVPVPIYPPGRLSGLEEHLRRHVRILDNAQAAALITVPEARTLARLVAPRVATMRQVVTVADLHGDGTAPPLASHHASATALLQYTSGSTGDPKGVVLSHANLLANIRAMAQRGEVGANDVFVSWLPLYHDMGLIGSWLLSLYIGIPFVVMSPLAFLARPARWLRAIHEHGGTLSGGPNFGYELCLRRIDDTELEGVDLSSWRIAFNGAEPVSPDTVTRFTRRFGRFGLQAGAMAPVYGLAECSVALTVPSPGRGPLIDLVAREPLARSGHAVPAPADDPTAARIVACGRPLPGHEVRIVDRAGAVLEERREGRVQFRGPSATAGYHRNPAATKRLLHGDWLDSGDLGYLAGGELHLTGRLKDLIIRAGRNLHPSELEEAVGAVAGVRKGCVVAFPSPDPGSGTERLVVVAETRVTDEHEQVRIRTAVNEAVTDIAGTPADDIVLVGPGTVPKTSSGKVRRAATREGYETGRLGGPGPAVWRQVLRIALPGVLARARRTVARAGAAIYGVYARALFAIVALVAWPLLILVPGIARRWRIVRAGGRVLLGLAGIRLRIVGRDLLPADRPYVVAANHASFLDPLLLTMLLPEPVVFTAIGGLADNPVVRIVLRRMQSHLVERGDRARGIEDSRVLTEVVRSGRVVAFFPEGRRSPAPGLEPFRMGAFVVAADAGVPVVPVTLRGTRHILPVGRRWPRHGPITVTVAPPVSSSHTGWSGAVELHRATRAAILRDCGEPDLA